MMKVLGFIGIIVAIFSIRFCAAQQDYDTEKLDIYYNTGTVQTIGQCNKTDCSFTLKTSDGLTMNSTSSDPVSVGQIVYQQCWTERVKGSQCYVNFSPSK